MGMRSAPTMLIALIGLTAASCSGGDSPSSGSAADASSSSADSSEAGSQSVSAAPTSTTPPIVIDDGRLSGIAVPSGPNGLATDEYGVWVKLDDGTVQLLDPASNTIIDSVELGEAGCHGLGAGDGAIWTCRGPDIAKIDAVTRAVVSRTAVDKTPSQRELPVVEGQVWVLAGDGSTLLGVLTETHEIWSRFPLLAPATDVEVGEAGMWVVSTFDDVVMKIDPVTGHTLQSVTIDSPVAVAVDHEVWVGTPSESMRINAAGDIDLYVAAGTGADGALALTPTEVWVRDAEQFLTRVDRATGDVLEVVAWPAQLSSAVPPLTGSGDVAYAFGSIWTTINPGGLVVRLPAPGITG